MTVRKVLLAVLTGCLLARHLSNEMPATASFWQNETITEAKYTGLIELLAPELFFFLILAHPVYKM